MQKLTHCVLIGLAATCGCSPAEQAERAADALTNAAHETEPAAGKRPTDRAPVANPSTVDEGADQSTAGTNVSVKPSLARAIPTGDGVLPLDDEASGLAFSPDGTLLAVGLTFGGVQLWDMTTRTKQVDLPASFGTTHALAFSPDGGMLASGHTRDEGNVILWDVAAGQQKARLAGHTDKVYAVAFSPTGSILASAGTDRTIRIWNAATRELQRVLEGHQNEIRGLAFSPDGSLLASSSGDFLKKLPGEVIVWNTRTGEQIKAMEAKQAYDVAFAPDGNSLLATDGEGISIWNTETWAPPRQLRQVLGFGFEYERIDVSPDGRLAAVCGLAIDSVVWDLEKGEAVQELPQMRDVAFAPQGHLLAGGNRKSEIQLADVGSLVKPTAESLPTTAGKTPTTGGSKATTDRELIEPRIPIVATRMQQAIHGNNRRLMNRILRRHPDAVRWKLGRKEGAALHMAAFRGHVVFVKQLLESGANPNARNNEGDLPLGSAAGAGHAAVVQLLLENGADKSLKNAKGETPLDIATRKGRDEVVKLLR